ncbi:MAG: hypothetical protein RLZZ306_2982 [Bacteroidota bacterium]
MSIFVSTIPKILMKKYLLLPLFLFLSQLAFGQRIYSVIFDNLPQDYQLYPRTDKNEAIVPISGQIELANWKYLSVVVLRDKQPYQYQRSEIKYNTKGDVGTFDLKPLIKSELAEYDFQIYASQAGKDSVLMAERKNIVAGDLFVITGQSNAVAYGVGYLPYNFTNKYCRTFGLPKFGKEYTQADTTWSNSDFTVGAWGLEIQRLILEKYKIPTCIINGGVPGTQIDLHQKNNNNPIDLGSIYGRLLYRVQKTKAINKVKAIFFWQGENDIFENEPDSWGDKFDKLFSSWRKDYTSTNKFYVFQINIVAFKKYGSGTQRDYQRRIQDIYAPFVESISTVGNFGYDGGHYTNEGYFQFGRECFNRIERDFYGVKSTINISSPSIKKAFYTSPQKNEIALVFDEGQEMVWKSDTILKSDDGTTISQFAKNYFYLASKGGLVISGKADKNKIILTLNGSSDFRKITYLPPYFPFDDTEKRRIFGGPFLQNKSQVKALSFQDFIIDETDISQPTKLATPELGFTTTTFNSVTLAWKPVDGATKFVLERDSSGLGFKVLANIKGSELSYFDQELTPNTKYNYRIKAENSNITSDYSTNSVVTLALLSKPEISSTILYYNSVKIAWKPVLGALSYQVDRKEGNEAFKQILKISGNISEIIEKDLKENTNYSYRIKGFGDKTESLESTISVQTPTILTTPVLSQKNLTHESVKLKWNAIANASKYILERQSQGETSFQQIFETDNLLEFTDLKLKPNNTYSYRLKVSNSFSESQYIKVDLKTMSILSVISEQYNLFKIYPNPANQKLTILFNEAISGIVELIDLMGGRIFEQNLLKQKSVEMNVSNFKKGIYLVLIKTNQELYSQKVIIE